MRRAVLDVVRLHLLEPNVGLGLASAPARLGLAQGLGKVHVQVEGFLGHGFSRGLVLGLRGVAGGAGCEAGAGYWAEFVGVTPPSRSPWRRWGTAGSGGC